MIYTEKSAEAVTGEREDGALNFRRLLARTSSAKRFQSIRAQSVAGVRWRARTSPAARRRPGPRKRFFQRTSAGTVWSLISPSNCGRQLMSQDTVPAASNEQSTITHGVDKPSRVCHFAAVTLAHCPRCGQSTSPVRESQESTSFLIASGSDISRLRLTNYLVRTGTRVKRSNHAAK